MLADVHAHLASSRVVTLVGPGGVGKTRVALRIADAARRTFPDGCWVVPLGALSESDLLIPAVAEALGLYGADGPWQVDALADYLAERTALLVLDNCEQLIAAVSDLVQGLRAACPNVRFLLTSRRPLRLSGEDVLVVPPLSLPDEATVATPETIAHHEAVNLFLDRAVLGTLRLPADRGQRPGRLRACVVTWTDCRWPSSLLLRGSRRCPRWRFAQSLAERLSGAQPGLSRRRREAPVVCGPASTGPISCCSPHEQRFWARSSVFSGYDLTAATEVCAADDLPAGEIFDLMTTLVDQSIVIAEPSDLGHTRYRMLADIRQFGLERAEKDGELHGMQERHATWCAELVSEFDTAAGGPHQADWLGRLRLEQANLRSALEHFAEAPDGADAGSGHGKEVGPVLVRLRFAGRGAALAGAGAGRGSRDGSGAWRWR